MSVLVPASLPWPAYLRWVQATAYRTVATLWAGGDSSNGPDLLDVAWSLNERDADPDEEGPLAALVAVESADAPSTGLGVADPAEAASALLSKLTRRQCDVLLLLADGLTVVQVAERLKCSPATVRVHKHDARARLTRLKTPARIAQIV